MFADEDDMAIIKAAAVRRGVPEAEVLREAIHLAAMANQTWDEPFFTHTYPRVDGSPQVRVDDVLRDVWTEEAKTYGGTRNPNS